MREKILDDAARLAGGAMGIVGSLRAQIKAEIKSRIDEMALKLDLVPRAEFERLEAMLQKLRMEQEEIKKNLKTASSSAGTSKKTTKQPAVLKTVKKPSPSKPKKAKR
jgi:BMFP domain-containing protein YqiC